MSQIINLLHNDYSVLVSDSRISNITNGTIFSDTTDKVFKVSDNVMIGFVGDLSFGTNVINTLAVSSSAQLCDTACDFVSNYCKRYALGAQSSFILSGIDSSDKFCTYTLEHCDRFQSIRKDANQDTTEIETAFIGAVSSTRLFNSIIRCGYDFRSPAEAIKCGQMYIRRSARFSWTINNICSFRIVASNSQISCVKNT